MSTPVLVAIILIAVSCAAALTRLRLADRRSVAAHHRALETMARLVAQRPTTEPGAGPEHPAGHAYEQSPAQAHVRLVTGTEAPEPAEAQEPPVPPSPPPLRSRPRRGGPRPLEYASWEDVAPVEPAPIPEVRPESPAPVPVAAAASTPAPAAVLHFDALAEPPLARNGNRAAPEPGAPPATRHWHRPRRARAADRRRRRRSGRALRRTAVGAVVVLVLAGAAIGGILVSRIPSAPVRTPPPVAHQAAPPTTRATVPATAPPPAAPVLVSSGAGYSEYRLSGPATIVLSASGRCWVEIRQSGPSGPVLFQGVLVAGETQGAPGSTWVRLGNPSNVTVRVNGVTISPPSLIAGEPYNLQFD
jgi:hypothetical protein